MHMRCSMYMQEKQKVNRGKIKKDLIIRAIRKAFKLKLNIKLLVSAVDFLKKPFNQSFGRNFNKLRYYYRFPPFFFSKFPLKRALYSISKLPLFKCLHQYKHFSLVRYQLWFVLCFKVFDFVCLLLATIIIKLLINVC